MKKIALPALLLLVLAQLTASAVNTPSGVVTRAGDRSIVLHWNRNSETNLAGYRVYRAAATNGPYSLQSTNKLLTSPGFADLKVANSTPYFYQITAVVSTGDESPPSPTITTTPHLFSGNDEFLDYVQQTAFDYFWYEANPANGLVPDRSTVNSPCSIAAVGFGLTAINIGIDHGWITREQGRQRVLTTLNTFLNQPQGTNVNGNIGYKGWFYHFLDMKTALPYTTFSTELSSIDTALLLGGVIDARHYFTTDHPDEMAIRSTADALVDRLDWNFMAQNGDVLSMGWYPKTGFLSAYWVGYNEASILYILGLGAPTNPLPASAWTKWTSGYTWSTNYGVSFVPFPPLFGHQYSQCWLDLRHSADPYMRNRGSTYFENSRRATIAQRSYCIANPLARAGYGGYIWGLTASDGPSGYSARGVPPAQNDDGTIAPTAAGGSVAFAPEFCVPTLRYMYDHFRTFIWTSYGFCDAFNLGSNWWDADVLGIDQGPIVIMIENYRNQKVWKRFMQDDRVKRGLQRAGFLPLSFMSPRLTPDPLQNQVNLSWDAASGKVYQVEYSPNLDVWYYSPTGQVSSAGTLAQWTDSGPPATDAKPFSVSQRFYRVFQFSQP